MPAVGGPINQGYIMQQLSLSMPTANKSHECDACLWLLDEGYIRMVLTTAELRSVAKAKANNWHIVKGGKYIKSVAVENGEFATFKAIPEIHEICRKHNLYPDL